MVEEQEEEDGIMDVDETVSDSDMSTNDDTDDQDEPDDPFQILKSHCSYEKLLEDYEQYLVLASMITCGTEIINTLSEWCFCHSAHSEPRKVEARTDLSEVTTFKSTFSISADLFELFIDSNCQSHYLKQCPTVW